MSTAALGWAVGVLLVVGAVILVRIAVRDKYGYEDPRNAIDDSEFAGMWDGSSQRDKMLRGQEGVAPPWPPTESDHGR